MFNNAVPLGRTSLSSAKAYYPGLTGPTFMAELNLADLGPYTTGGWDLKDCVRFGLPVNNLTGGFIAMSHSCDGCNRPAPSPYGLILDVGDPTCPRLLAYDGKDELEDGADAPDCTVCMLLYAK